MTDDQDAVRAGPVDVSVDLCGVRMRNPLMLASGVLGANAGILAEVARHGAGAIVTKTVGPGPRPGHRNPCFIEPAENVFLNAMGLNNPGCEEFLKELHVLCDGAVPVVASIFGETPEEFESVARTVQEADIALLEVNVSCPHAKRRSRGAFLGQEPALVAQVTERVRGCARVPVVVKLSPNVTSIVETARAAVGAGADALCAINTVQAIEIDPFFEKPVLGNAFGGQSGPSIRCIALRKVVDLVLAMRAGELPTVPVVGVGGIRSGQDVARFLLAGAQCVQIGSAVYYDDLAVFRTAEQGLRDLMAQKGYGRLADFRGKALRWLDASATAQTTRTECEDRCS